MQFPETMMSLDLFSTTVGFLVGTLTGAAGKYFADKYTDRRRSKEAAGSDLTQFLDSKHKMQELIAEIRKDLKGKPVYRDFFVLPNSRVVFNSRAPCFVYYEDAHDALLGKIRILENHGYLTDITPGDTPRYTMSEEFVAFVLEHG